MRQPVLTTAQEPVRFLLFAGFHSRPRGGTDDVIGVFDSESAARCAFLETRRGRADHEGWAELAVLDGRGELTRLGWFGIQRPKPDGRPARSAVAVTATAGPRSRWSFRQRRRARR